MIAKTTYIRRRDASLRALDLEIIRMKSLADIRPEIITSKYKKAIQRLHSTRDVAARKLRELQQSGEYEWNNGEASYAVEQAWDEIRIAVLYAISATYAEPVAS